MKKLISPLIIALLFSACASTPPAKEDVVTKPAPTEKEVVTEPTSSEGKLTTEPIVVAPPVKEEPKKEEQKQEPKTQSPIIESVPALPGLISKMIDPDPPYSPGCNFIYSDLQGNAYKLKDKIYCNTAMRHAVSPDGRFLIYVAFPDIVLFDSVTQTNTKLMSVLNNTDGVDFYWSPDSRTIAMSVVNQQDPTYTSSSGTKLYILGINEKSELLRKDRHLLKLRYGCHDAGCNVDPEDLYFKDNNTVVYRTWNDDPYEAAGDDSLLRTLSW